MFYRYFILTEILHIYELFIFIGILTTEAKAEIERHPVIVESKINKCPYNLKSCKRFCLQFLLLKLFFLFLVINNFLVYLFSNIIELFFLLSYYFLSYCAIIYFCHIGIFVI